MSDFPFIIPQWSPPNNVKALMSTRLGGVSPVPYNSMNVGTMCKDTQNNISQNKARLKLWLGQQGLKQGDACYLKQVHGTHILNLDDVNSRSQLNRGEELEADACFTTMNNVVCAVRVADCMPVLLATPKGVAAIHAGWKGLAQGIVTKTLNPLLETTKERVEDITAWLGPCIGKNKFEVGMDVKLAFESKHTDNRQAFMAHPSKEEKWFADLLWLAQNELSRNGVKNIFNDGRCTFTEEDLFFSYRRDQTKLGGTGRMIACIWKT